MSEQTAFYNTTGLKNEDLMAAIESAKKQDDRVLLIFQVKSIPLSASDVWKTYKAWFPNNTPLTSIRRSISNLASNVYLKDVIVKKAQIKKTTFTKEGIYGKPEFLWTI